jgi:hypothetical protein
VAAEDGAVGRLDTKADLALNHGMALGTLGSVVVGLEALNL